MRRILLLAAAFLAFEAFAQTPLQRYLDGLDADGPLKGAVWGFEARTPGGEILVSHHAQQRMVPASNLKLITTGAALHAFGGEYRFSTQLGYSGSIRPDGTLEGDLYIVGGGDPTIGARDSIALASDALFWKWKCILKEKGISRIQGRIIGDGRAWEGMLEHPSWSYDDTGTYYGTGSNALCFYQNSIDLDVRATAPGQPVQAVQTYPETPWMHCSNYSVTGPAGSGNSLYLYTTDLAPYSELRGSFATDRRPKTEHFANKFGALTCAYYFWKNLRATGWEVTGGYAQIDRGGRICGADFIPGEAAAAPQLLGATQSPSLAQIVRTTNVRSDNFYAEALYRAMGEAATGIAVYDSCRVAVRDVLLDLGLDPDALRQEDGSGLSRVNQLSPSFMASFLQRMTLSPAFPAFLASLPHPGEGTLANLQLQGARRVCLKSGSMGGVLCYSGYILDAEGRPETVLSFMSNGGLAQAARIRAVFAQILLYL